MKSQTFFTMFPAADTHHLHSSTISVRGPHVAPSLYFIWWRKIELSMLIKSNSALMRRRLSNFEERSQTTSLQLVPDAGDHVIERLTHTSSARPHTSTVTSSSFHFQVTSQEVSGKLMVKFTLHFEGVLHSSGGATIQRTTKMMNWLSSRLFQEFTESNADSTRHTKHQILTLPDPVSFPGAGLAEQTAGLLQHHLSSWQNPLPHPQAPVCSYTYSTAFSMWGALDTSKSPVWELQWGVKQPQPSWAGSHLSVPSKHMLETGCLWLIVLSVRISDLITSGQLYVHLLTWLLANKHEHRWDKQSQCFIQQEINIFMYNICKILKSV